MTSKHQPPFSNSNHFWAPRFDCKYIQLSSYVWQIKWNKIEMNYFVIALMWTSKNKGFASVSRRVQVVFKRLQQCFPTFFDSQHPYVVLKIFCGTPSWFNRYTNQGIVAIGGTPDTNSRHPCVSRHPGWESLVYSMPPNSLIMFFLWNNVKTTMSNRILIVFNVMEVVISIQNVCVQNQT